MINKYKRINVIVGHYGSGKTEFAVNLALKLKKSYEKVYIVDLDIVNPYFRTNDVRSELEAFGIEVIAPEYANTNVDLPSLPPDIMKVFYDNNAAVVFDVGGDEDGAVALGRYNEFLKKEYNMLFVINKSRPMTQNAEDTIEIIREIEKVSRLSISGLVNNSNLQHLTDLKCLMDGELLCEEVSNKIGIEVSYISGTKDVLELLDKKYDNKKFELKRYLKLDYC